MNDTQVEANTPQGLPSANRSPPGEIRGVIDGFRYPARINGWIIKRQGDTFLTDIRVEVRRGATVIAQTTPSGPRRDVTKDEITPAGFFLDLVDVAIMEELINGRVAILGVDADGRSKDLHFHAPTRQKAIEDIAAAKTQIDSPSSPSADSKIVYWRQGEPCQNFGDYLSELFLDALFYPASPDVDAVHLVGSVIDDMFVRTPPPKQQNKSILFWGCGLRRPGGLRDELRQYADILAVRGPLSAAELKCTDDIPQADPGLLLPALHTPRSAPMFEERTVCIPHFHDQRSDQELLRISGCEIVLRPNIDNSIEALRRFIDSVTAAGFVLSAALHGAITAAAYGRSFAFWDNGQIDLPFKWEDFAASIRIPTVFQSHIEAAKLHYDTAIKPKIHIPSLFQLLARSPLPVRPYALLKMLHHELTPLANPETLAALEIRTGLFATQNPHVDKLNRLSKVDLHINSAHKQESVGPLKGAIDRIDHTAISGWAVDTANLDCPVALEIVDNDEVIANITADQYRKDLAAGGFGKGYHGFVFRYLRGFSRAANHTIVVRRKVDKLPIPGTQAFLGKEPVRFDRDIQRLFARLIANDAKSDPCVEDLNQKIDFLLGQTEKLIDARTKLAMAGEIVSPATIRQRWIKALANYIHDANSAAECPPIRPHALFIDYALPLPNHDAGSNAAIGQMLSLMRLGYAVSCVGTNTYNAATGDSYFLKNIGIQTFPTPEYGNVEDIFLSSNLKFDIIYFHRVSTAASYLAMAREYFPEAHLIYSVADLHFLRSERQAVIEQKGTTDAGLKQDELELARMADAVITHSPYEAAILTAKIPIQKVHVIPWPIQAAPRRIPVRDRRGVAFIGGYQHAPNIDAAKWLVEEIMPRVSAFDRGIECFLVGSDMPEELVRISRDGIIPLGYVKDLDSVFNRVRLTIAPLRFGAGIKGKVLDSLGAGIPCVCTSIAAEGIPLPGSLKHYVADSAEGLAELIYRLHNDLEENVVCSEAGLELCRTEFSEAKIDSLMKIALAAR